jgi:hypothetical protein
MSNMKLATGIFVAAALITGVLLFSMVAAARWHDDLNDEGSARSVSQVSVIRLETESCSSGIIAGLGERGFSVSTTSDRPDAVMQVEVNTTGRNFDDLPSFGGVGNRASYSAVMRGEDGKVLFSTSGNEGSINMAELCGDIGDDIGDRLKAQKG